MRLNKEFKKLCTDITEVNKDKIILNIDNYIYKLIRVTPRFYTIEFNNKIIINSNTQKKLFDLFIKYLDNNKTNDLNEFTAEPEETTPTEAEPAQEVEEKENINNINFLNNEEIEIIKEYPINRKYCKDYTKAELINIAKENNINIDITATKENIFISIYNWILEGDETKEAIEEFYSNTDKEQHQEQQEKENYYYYSKNNLSNILKHIEEVKNFYNSKSIEHFGNYAAAQRGSFRIIKYNDNNLYIKAMLETKENYFEKLEIFEEYNKAINLYIEFLASYQLDYIKYLEDNQETEQEQQIREDKEYICDFIEEHRHIKKINPFIENNKIEYFISVQNYIEVYYIDKDNYNFNAVIQDYQYIKRNIDRLEVEDLIQSVFSIMKNYNKYRLIDNNFINSCIDFYTCLDITISDLKDIIIKENIKDITIESDLITMYKNNEVIAEINIKNEIPGYFKRPEEEKQILLKYFYDKLKENNINYNLIVAAAKEA